jgi:hypothetical protein
LYSPQFTCEVKKIKIKEKEANVKIKCEYSGEDVGLINPKNITSKLSKSDTLHKLTTLLTQTKKKLIYPGKQSVIDLSYKVNEVSEIDLTKNEVIIDFKNVILDTDLVPIFPSPEGVLLEYDEKKRLKKTAILIGHYIKKSFIALICERA